MDNFITALMKKMTLEEKIGQLNLVATGEIVTGNCVYFRNRRKIAEGKVGGVFNVKSIEKISSSCEQLL